MCMPVCIIHFRWDVYTKVRMIVREREREWETCSMRNLSDTYFFRFRFIVCAGIAFIFRWYWRSLFSAYCSHKLQYALLLNVPMGSFTMDKAKAIEKRTRNVSEKHFSAIFFQRNSNAFNDIDMLKVDLSLFTANCWNAAIFFSLSLD